MKVYKLNCPACKQKLYFLNSTDCYEDYSEDVCRSCRYKFGCVKAKVTNFAFRTETYQNNKIGEQPQYSLIYQLVLLKTNGNCDSLSFHQPKHQKTIYFEFDDELLLLYTIKGKILNKLVWVGNHTTSESLLLQHPGTEARSFGVASSVITFTISLAIASVFHLPINKLFLAKSILFSVGIGIYTTNSKTLKISDSQELKRFYSKQNLLIQDFELEQKVDELLRELQTNQRISLRLKAIKNRMKTNPTIVYLEQSDTVNRAISVLEEQINLAQSLLDGYQKVIECIEIEYETLRLAEQLPENIIQNTVKRLEELKVMENKKEEMNISINLKSLIDEY